MALPIEEWTRYQRELAARVRERPLAELPRYVAGVDCAFPRGIEGEEIACVALVWDRERGEVVDRARVHARCSVPYVPTFLSFREGPAVREALSRLTHPYGAVLFDAHGRAHPRRCGLATHVGVELGLVAVGVAKSRLTGTHDEPGQERGEAAPLRHRGEIIGQVVRTRRRVRPVYISVGNNIDLSSAVRLALACVTKYRLPEPTRLADADVDAFKQELA